MWGVAAEGRRRLCVRFALCSTQTTVGLEVRAERSCSSPSGHDDGDHERDEAGRFAGRGRDVVEPLHQLLGFAHERGGGAPSRRGDGASHQPGPMPWLVTSSKETPSFWPPLAPVSRNIARPVQVGRAVHAGDPESGEGWRGRSFRPERPRRTPGPCRTAATRSRVRRAAALGSFLQWLCTGGVTTAPAHPVRYQEERGCKLRTGSRLGSDRAGQPLLFDAGEPRCASRGVLQRGPVLLMRTRRNWRTSPSALYDQGRADRAGPGEHREDPGGEADARRCGWRCREVALTGADVRSRTRPSIVRRAICQTDGLRRCSRCSCCRRRRSEHLIGPWGGGRRRWSAQVAVECVGPKRRCRPRLPTPPHEAAGGLRRPLPRGSDDSCHKWQAPPAACQRGRNVRSGFVR